MRQDLTTPAQVRGMIAILNNLGLVPDAVVVDDYRLLQLPRLPDETIDLVKVPEDTKMPFALKFGDINAEVSHLWEIVLDPKGNYGMSTETKVLWLVRAVKPEIETHIALRNHILSLDKFAAPYRAALAAALKG
jgi:hypothetical protein